MGRITGYTSPEGTVSYTYDANGNVLTVTDSHGTITKTYDVNNRVIGVTKPDGSVTTTVYDNMQRVTSTVEKTASGAVISGFNYTYDNLSRVVEETVLANSTKLCYTYDALSCVTKRKVKNLCDEVLCEETFSYDAAGNITDSFAYDTYGKCICRTGTSDVIFGYNGKDGVVTDKNGLIYMRARYYSPKMKRFINADIVAGDIGSVITLNRFAYANGNPVSLTDPFGLSAESDSNKLNTEDAANFVGDAVGGMLGAFNAVLRPVKDLLCEGAKLLWNGIESLF